MKPSAVLNKFDKKVQEVYEALDNLKEVLDNTEDYELTELAEGFCEQRLYTRVVEILYTVYTIHV